VKRYEVKKINRPEMDFIMRKGKSLSRTSSKLHRHLDIKVGGLHHVEILMLKF
jgi:hypothetical protein